MVDSTFLRKHTVKERQCDMPFITHILLHNVYNLNLSQSLGNCGGNKIFFQKFTFNFFNSTFIYTSICSSEILFSQRF